MSTAESGTCILVIVTSFYKFLLKHQDTLLFGKDDWQQNIVHTLHEWYWNGKLTCLDVELILINKHEAVELQPLNIVHIRIEYHIVRRWNALPVYDDKEFYGDMTSEEAASMEYWYPDMFKKLIGMQRQERRNSEK